MPVGATSIVPVLLAGAYRHYRGITTALSLLPNKKTGSSRVLVENLSIHDPRLQPYHRRVSLAYSAFNTHVSQPIFRTIYIHKLVYDTQRQINL